MIEVERKFKPTQEQLAALLADSQFKEEVINHDIIYDYPDYHMIMSSTRLRKRNGDFELKISEGNEDHESGFAAREIKNEEEIKQYFHTDLPIVQFVQENLIEAINYKTTRRKYEKGDFEIDVDNIDFGYQCVEIELMVNDASQVPIAQERILELAKKYNFSIEHVSPKKKEYFRVVKPEVFKKLYPNG